MGGGSRWVYGLNCAPGENNLEGKGFARSIKNMLNATVTGSFFCLHPKYMIRNASPKICSVSKVTITVT